MNTLDDSALMVLRGQYSTKTCNRCNEPKAVDCFSLDRSKKDGLRTLCKACTALTYKSPKTLKQTADRMRELRKTEKWKAYYKESAKAWRKTPKGQAYSLVSNRQAAQAHPERHLARKVVNEAVRYGHLEKVPCFCCGDSKVEARHPDYSRPLDVVWLCQKHHGEIHYGLP